MIKPIVKNERKLSVKSERFIFGKDDYIINDMIDTAEAHKDTCVGLAAVQIGYNKRVILVRNGDKFIPYINPTIFYKGKQTYVTNESCLSLEGERSVKRHVEIKMTYTDINGKPQAKTFRNYTAQIMQHECDHLNGVIIWKY